MIKHEDKYVKELAYRLTIIRKYAKLSRREVVDKFNINLPTLRSWEEGKSDPSAGKLLAYLREYKKHGIEVCYANLFDLDNPLRVLTQGK